MCFRTGPLLAFLQYWPFFFLLFCKWQIYKVSSSCHSNRFSCLSCEFLLDLMLPLAPCLLHWPKLSLPDWLVQVLSFFGRFYTPNIFHFQRMDRTVTFRVWGFKLLHSLLPKLTALFPVLSPSQNGWIYSEIKKKWDSGFYLGDFSLHLVECFIYLKVAE